MLLPRASSVEVRQVRSTLLEHELLVSSLVNPKYRSAEMDRLHVWYGTLHPDRSLETSGRMFDCDLERILELAAPSLAPPLENTEPLTVHNGG